MLLFAAFVPPREILDDLWSVLHAQPDRAAAGGAGRHRALRRRKAKATVEVAGPESALDLAPVAHLNLTLAKFGNLALHDANRLEEALRGAAAQWPSPRLRLTGYSTLEAQDDPSIWVDLEGDLDALQDIVRGVHQVAQGLRLFVDRRVFQPRVRVGAVRPSATEDELEALLAALAAFETNAWWQTGFGLYTLADQGRDLPSFKPVADIPLGPHVVH